MRAVLSYLGEGALAEDAMRLSAMAFQPKKMTTGSKGQGMMAAATVPVTVAVSR